MRSPVEACQIPKKRQLHHSYDEDADEPATLIDKEAADVEAEIPAEENEPIETSGREAPPASSPFEEE